MPIAQNFTSVYTKEWEINFSQCLPNGYLKYTELCNILQLTAAFHSELGGISFSDMQEYNQAWVLSKMRVEITELPKWKDKVTVKTWINTLENSRSIRAFEIEIKGKKIVGSETFWAVFNTKTRRPEPLTLPYEHFELYEDKKATEKPLSRISLINDTEIVFKRTIVLSDLDIVNHVNNVKYLEWCLDLADENLILKQKLASFEMNFLKELSFNETVEIHESILKSNNIFSIIKENKVCFALELKWK